MAYVNVCNNGFVYDDASVIKDNRWLKTFSHVKHLFDREEYFSPRGIGKYKRYGEGSYRPIVTLSYFIDYAIAPNNPFASHLINLLYHLIAVILLYRLLCALSDQRPALLAALLFAVHPAATETINAISFREDILCTMFICLTLLWFIRFAHRTLHSYGWFAGSLLCFFLAALSKENGVIVPALAVLYVLFIYSPRHNISRRTAFLRFLPAYFLYALTTGIYLIIRFNIFNYTTDRTPDANLLMRVVRFINVIMFYLQKILFPARLTPAYNDGFLINSALLGISIPLLAGILFIIVRSLRRAPLISFGLGWYLVTLLPVSGLMYLQHPVAERYMYLPMIGIFISVASLCYTNIRCTKILIPVWCVLITSATAKSMTQNTVWKSEFSLWDHAVQYVSKNYNAFANYAVVLADNGNQREAIGYYQKALAIDQRAQSYYNLANSYNRLGETDEAIKAYRKSIQIDPSYSEAHNNLGRILAERGNYQAALEELRSACQQSPYNFKAFNNLGACLNHLEQYDEAIDALQYAISLAPGYLSALVNLTTSYYKKGDYLHAEQTLHKILSIDPNNEQARQYLTIVKQAANENTAPAVTEKPVQNVQPQNKKNFSVQNMLPVRDSDALLDEGDQLMAAERYEQALAKYRIASRTDSQNPEAHFKLAQCYIKLGSFSLARRELLTVQAIKPGHIQASRLLNDVERILKIRK